MNPLQFPRLWARIAALVALAVAVWLLLIPRTALYLVDDAGHPYDIRVLYSWGTTDQAVIGALDPGSTEILSSVRLDCGTSFTAGEHEDDQPGDGPEACSQLEAPRRVIGLLLAALGLAGLVGAFWLPQSRFPEWDL